MRRIFLILGLSIGAVTAQDRTPNIVLIVADDLGYADLGCYGATFFETPHIDQMAAEGVRLTSFYQAASTCSASRAAMLTGRYPERNGITNDYDPVAGSLKSGLDPEEKTIAEVLREKGYATACFGKWHLGAEKQFLPKAQGFDVFFGMPFHHAEAPIIDGIDIIEKEPVLQTLTERFTQHALMFIREKREQPFFLYLAHAMPSAPVYVGAEYSGKADYGLYGDAVMEIDGSVGQILEALKAEGLDENTLVIFTSDNGPALDAGPDSGSADPLREGKGTRYEGGHRVPFVARFPKKIKAGTESGEIATGLDLLSTFAGLAGATAPSNVDGLDLWPWLSGKAEKSPRDTFFYSRWVVRQGPWKYLMPGKYEEYENAELVERDYSGSRLFYLPQDPGESRSLHADYSSFVLQLAEACKKHQAHLDGVEYVPPKPPEEKD